MTCESVDLLQSTRICWQHCTDECNDIKWVLMTSSVTSLSGFLMLCIIFGKEAKARSQRLHQSAGPQAQEKAASVEKELLLVVELRHKIVIQRNGTTALIVKKNIGF